jgi:hypothetical protein
MSQQNLAPADIMLQMISGFWVSRIVYAAAKLGIADWLQDRPKTVAELATLTNTHAPSLYRLLRALASVGIFEEIEKQQFGMTPLAQTLQTGVPGSLRYMAIGELGYDHSIGWGNLMQSLETGDIGFDLAAGMSVWDYYTQHPEYGEPFNQYMTSITAMVQAAVLSSYDFSGFNTLVDVGGGQGSLLASIVDANPHLQGILYDLPPVIVQAQQHLQSVGSLNRIQPIAGDFFESVPVGGDIYLMKWIIHDWDEEKCATILKNCHRAMPEHGKLLLVEAVVQEGNHPSFTKLLDVNMLVMTGGRERTAEEYRILLELSGFQLTRVISTPSPFHIIEAEKS